MKKTILLIILGIILVLFGAFLKIEKIAIFDNIFLFFGLAIELYAIFILFKK